MADEGFPLPGSSYAELTKLIQAWNKSGADASNADVGRLLSIDETVVSRNNKFFLAIGILTGGHKKTITEQGMRLARAIEFNNEEDTIASWQNVIRSCDFLTKLLDAIRIRKAMDYDSLQSHIAYAAGQSRTQKSMTGAAAVIEILRNCRLIQETDGQITTANGDLSSAASGREPSVARCAADEVLTTSPSTVSIQTPSPSRESEPRTIINLNININISPSQAELGEVSKELINLFQVVINSK